ncbi:MAG TPA: hypothetical protein VGH42_09990 [Verrucomicrobiae bacterium]|jgi:hypothetical protein
MTTINVISFTVGIFVIAIIWLKIAEALNARKIARCIHRIGFAICPQCKQVLGEKAASTAKQKIIKYRIKGFGRLLRSRNFPSELMTVICPHCSTKLEFRLDGNFFGRDHVTA